jgi:flagellar motor switch protein FliG
LSRLPDALQIEVVERLATTDQADPQVVRDIELGLENWLANQTQRVRRERAGISTATQLLEAASYDLRQSVLSHLAERDTALARRLAAAPLRPTGATRSITLTFDDLLQADDTILAAVISAADRHLATLALAGASKNILRRLERRLPGSDWLLLRSNIENLGPTRLSDVETAQQQLIRLALDLEAESKIDLSTIRPVDVTA